MQQYHQQRQLEEQHQKRIINKKDQNIKNPDGYISKKQQNLVPTETSFSNPIVNAILNNDPCAADIRSINHNICAICGLGFRLTGDLVHHMRKERCRNSFPYQKPKREKKN